MRVAFLGDIYVPSSKYADPNVSDIRQWLEGADEVIGNLEAPVIKKYAPIVKKGPVMAQHEKVLSLLLELHVSTVSLANNHIGDHGPYGIENTIETLEDNGVAHVGAGLDRSHIYKVREISKEGDGVAVLCAGEDGFGCQTPYREEHGYAWLFSPDFECELDRALHRYGSVVVVVHGGTEHTEQPLPQWRATFRRLIDRGVSAVVAHHPHVTQGIEEYEGRPIFYSIGNFYFGKERRVTGWHHAQVPMLEFGSRGLEGWEVLHSRFSITDGCEITVDETWGRARTERLSHILSNEELYRKALNQDLQWLWSQRYGHGVARSLPFAITGMGSVANLARRMGRVIFKGGGWEDPMTLEHYLNIESHRWALVEIMRLRANPGLSR